MVLEHCICEYHLYTDSIIRRYRKSGQRCTSGYASGRFGGTFPIEVAPAFFKAVYPLLPFVHSMAALRETIGGMYGMTYWTELGKLGIFLILSLILGLLLRKPVIRMNEAFAEKLEETKIM